MSDSQWSRYQVFQQSNENEPHQYVGSVHAPDPELALQNARDVFVRRPDCLSLWVAPAEQMLHRTGEQLAEWTAPVDMQPDGGQIFHIFCKLTSAGMAEKVGEVRADTAEQALSQALKKFTFKSPPFTWIVIPEQAVTRSTEEDIGPMFSAAQSKPFRQSSYYHVISEMRAARKQAKNQTGEGS